MSTANAELRRPTGIGCSELLESVVINEINLASVYEGSTHHPKNNHTKEKTQQPYQKTGNASSLPSRSGQSD
jgi:hypothetical protein